MMTPKPGTCQICKHWDAKERKKADYWAQTADPKWIYYVSAECHQIKEKVEIEVDGWDGYLKSVEPDADFGCVLFERC